MRTNMTRLRSLTGVLSLSCTLLVQADVCPIKEKDMIVKPRPAKVTEHVLNSSQCSWVENINAPRSKELQVTAWVDAKRQRSGMKYPIYHIGEEVVLYIKTTKDAYLTIIDVGTSGRDAIIIFPNRYQRNNQIKAGQVLRIPAQGSPEMIQVGGPPGQELIKIIATTQPISDYFNQPGFTRDLGPYQKLLKSSRAVSKDLNVVLRRRSSELEYDDYNKIIEIR